MDVQKEQEQQNRTDHVVSGFAFYSEKDNGKTNSSNNRKTKCRKINIFQLFGR